MVLFCYVTFNSCNISIKATLSLWTFTVYHIGVSEICGGHRRDSERLGETRRDSEIQETVDRVTCNVKTLNATLLHDVN